MIDINIHNIFFKSYSIDPNSGHSIYVFDSTYLPDPESIGNDKQLYDFLIDKLMDTLISKLPASPFSLVVFSSGFSEKKISWVYGVKMFAKIPREMKYYLQKTYIVHESFFIRTVYQVLSNAMSIKFLTKLNNYNTEISPLEEDSMENSSFSMVHIPDLTTLSHLIDITRLRISLNVYLHDYQINEYIDVPQDYFTRLPQISIKKYRQLIFDKIFKKLQNQAIEISLIFQKPGSYKKVNIFLEAMERNNYIDLSQWDIYSLASVFLNFLKTKAKTLVPIDLIRLPIDDTVDYTFQTFVEITNFNGYFDLFSTIIPLFISIIDNSEVTKHNSKSLSKALAPALCKEKLSLNNSARLAVGTRFIKNLLEHFDSILELYKSRNIEHPAASLKVRQPRLTSQNLEAPTPPRPRKTSPTKYTQDRIKNDSRMPSAGESVVSTESGSSGRSEKLERQLKQLSLPQNEQLGPTPPLIPPVAPQTVKPKPSVHNLVQQLKGIGIEQTPSRNVSTGSNESTNSVYSLDSPSITTKSTTPTTTSLSSTARGASKIEVHVENDEQKVSSDSVDLSSRRIRDISSKKWDNQVEQEVYQQEPTDSITTEVETSANGKVSSSMVSNVESLSDEKSKHYVKPMQFHKWLLTILLPTFERCYY
ncbi:Ecm25p KNAG_0C02150 [Huiozyma naganishii CBS 8797]|uniref:Rho-GAP domain-containing protein n=1 Tax=Huiozyma naganishii (strain ATCC MYA-139 / BCRC 22969 / CBS 8797 / KCTC 17520 / NBRC 10181 / NCYC 3082 / Yp74L-3) TaxID=1071383 RepID=J7S5R0_HUIN7|nr:hypothetical protein KNAG_0C02150 [Kazachstania naganishii CBS 8797]CCK69326.1 hypothetical protein KNAG_0C02150 [Kazachstania naganishii CBS 8797]